MAAHGVRLTGSGDELKGRCPFHDDKTPSLSVNGAKGVWHCFGCGASGNVRGFLERIGANGAARNGAAPSRKSSALVVRRTLNDIRDYGDIIERVVGLYHESLSRSKEAMA